MEAPTAASKQGATSVQARSALEPFGSDRTSQARATLRAGLEQNGRAVAASSTATALGRQLLALRARRLVEQESDGVR